MRKGVCRNGHDLSDSNSYTHRRGKKQCRRCQRETNRHYKEQLRLNGGEPLQSRVPAEPFAEWLRERVPEGRMEEWAKNRGIDPSNLRRITEGRQHQVHIITVDRVLVADGNPWVLEELYPLKVAA